MSRMRISSAYHCTASFRDKCPIYSIGITGSLNSISRGLALNFVCVSASQSVNYSVSNLRLYSDTQAKTNKNLVVYWQRFTTETRTCGEGDNQTTERDMATGQVSTHGCLNITTIMLIIYIAGGPPFFVCNRVNSRGRPTGSSPFKLAIPVVLHTIINIGTISRTQL